MSKKIVVAVRHPLMLRGLSAVLSESSQLNIVAQTDNIETISKICAEQTPGAVIVDSVLIFSQRGNTFAELSKRFANCRFVVIWLYEKPTETQKQFAPYNVVVEWTNTEDIKQNVLNTINGEEITHIDTYISEPNTLTARETEVLENIALGLTTTEIAGRLSISTRTAELHR